MMKNYSKGIFFTTIAFAILLVLSGCPKKDDDPVPFNKENLVGEWLLTELTAGNGSAQDQSVYDDLPACLTDNIFQYTVSGQYKQLEGSTKCDATDPDIVDEGTWQFNSAQFYYTDKDGLTAFFDILTLNSTTFTIRQETNFLGQQTTLTATYTKQ